MVAINLTPYLDKNNFMEVVYQLYDGYYPLKDIQYVLIKNNKIKVKPYKQSLWSSSPSDLIDDAVIHFTSEGFDFVGPISYKYDLNYWYKIITNVNKDIDYEYDENNRIIL